MGDVRDWSNQRDVGYQFTTPAPDGAPEGTPASRMNDTDRETMAAVRRKWEDMDWMDFGDDPSLEGPTTFSVPGDRGIDYQLGRRVRVTELAPTPGIFYGTITQVTGTGPTTVEVELDSGTLTFSSAQVALGSAVTGAPISASSIASTGVGSSEFDLSGLSELVIPLDPNFVYDIELTGLVSDTDGYATFFELSADGGSSYSGASRFVQITTTVTAGGGNDTVIGNSDGSSAMPVHSTAKIGDVRRTYAQVRVDNHYSASNPTLVFTQYVNPDNIVADRYRSGYIYYYHDLVRIEDTLRIFVTAGQTFTAGTARVKTTLR